MIWAHISCVLKKVITSTSHSSSQQHQVYKPRSDSASQPTASNLT